VLVVSRYRVPDLDSVEFRGRAMDALAALGEQIGFVRGHLGRNVDEPDLWVLSTEWTTVGAYRRALSSYDVKARAVPVMLHALDEPSAFEVLSTRAGD
jgi:heme-degrading monooxygenase HmoA